MPLVKDAKETETPDRLDFLVGDHAVRIRTQDGSMIIAQPGEIVKGVSADVAKRMVVARRGRAAAEFRERQPQLVTDDPAPAPKRGRGRPPKTETQGEG